MGRKKFQSGKKLVLLGPEGSFSSMAANRAGGRWERKYVHSFEVLFRAVKGTTFGLVPVRNKIVGKIPGVEKLLQKKPYCIVSKFRMPIRMVLAGKKKIPFDAIHSVFAAKVVKMQCEKFLKRNLDGAKFFTGFTSSPLAFKKIVQLKGKKAYQSAAIGSEKSAKLLKLRILARNIQDDKKDWTEFILLCLERKKEKGDGV